MPKNIKTNIEIPQNIFFLLAQEEVTKTLTYFWKVLQKFSKKQKPASFMRRWRKF